jgi:hypothetical protein
MTAFEVPETRKLRYDIDGSDDDPFSHACAQPAGERFRHRVGRFPDSDDEDTPVPRQVIKIITDPQHRPLVRYVAIKRTFDACFGQRSEEKRAQQGTGLFENTACEYWLVHDLWKQCSFGL